MKAAHFWTASTICSSMLKNQVSHFPLPSFLYYAYLGWFPPQPWINPQHISTQSSLIRRAEEFHCNIWNMSRTRETEVKICRVCDSDENTVRQLLRDKGFRCHWQNKRTRFSYSYVSTHGTQCISNRSLFNSSVKTLQLCTV